MWDAQLARFGAQLLHGRLRAAGRPGPAPRPGLRRGQRRPVRARTLPYRSSLREPTAAALAAGELPDADTLEKELLATFADVRAQEVERGLTLVGPHRDDVLLGLGPLPAKGYASHGESWSFALGLKLAAYQLLRSDLGEDPVLVLDDVFAELDTGRRERLAGLVERLRAGAHHRRGGRRRARGAARVGHDVCRDAWAR